MCAVRSFRQAFWLAAVVWLLGLGGVLCGGLGDAGGVVQAEEPLSFRKIYVPEEVPAEWPRGDWRPMSTRKFIQLTELGDAAGSQQSAVPIAEAHYRCRYQAGGLTDGTLMVRTQRSSPQSEWLQLGQTNVMLSGWREGDNSPMWGTGQDGQLYLFQSGETAEYQVNWSAPAFQATAEPRFRLRLLPALQGSFSILLPNHLAVQVTEPRRLPVFRKQVDADWQEWTITGLEGSRLYFSIQPAVTQPEQQPLFSRQVHQLMLAPAEQMFVSDFKFEQLLAPITELEIALPEQFQIDSVQLQQEWLTTWKQTPAESGSGSILRLTLPQNLPTPQGTLRLRGVIGNFQQLKLKTGFPQLLNAITLETQVNLVVQSPYVMQQLQTTGLKQIDARLVSGVRDVWTYTASSAAPEVALRVAVPDPLLEIEQLTLVRPGSKVFTVHQLMLWTTTQDRTFGTTFQVAPGYDVHEVTILTEGEAAPPLTWSLVQKEKQPQQLIIHLPNQLVLDRPLPLVVTLKKNRAFDDDQQLVLPPLLTQQARLRSSGLIENNLQLMKTIPEGNIPHELPAEIQDLWTILRSPRLQAEELRWQADWKIRDIAPVTRVLAEVREEAERSGLPVLHDPAEPYLETELIRQNRSLFVRYRLHLPAEAFGSRKRMQVLLSQPGPALQWTLLPWPDAQQRNRTGGRARAARVAVSNEAGAEGQGEGAAAQQAESSASGAEHEDALQPASPPAVYETVLTAEYPGYVFPRQSHTTTQAGQVYEAFAQVPLEQSVTVPLPFLSGGRRFHGRVLWNREQFTRTDAVAGTGRNRSSRHGAAANGSNGAGGASGAETTSAEFVYSNSYELGQIRFEAVVPAVAVAEKLEAEPEPWQVQAWVLAHAQPGVSDRFWLTCQAPSANPTATPRQLTFPTPVRLHSMIVNGQTFPIEREVTQVRIPKLTEPARQLELHYSCPRPTAAEASAESLVFPVWEMPTRTARLTLALPESRQPQPREPVLHWQAVTADYLTASSLPRPEQISQQTAAVLEGTLTENRAAIQTAELPDAASETLQKLISEQNYRLYVGLMVDQPLTDIQLATVPRVQGSGLAFGIGLLAVVCLLAVGHVWQLTARSWLPLAGAGVLLVLVSPAWMTVWLTPLAVALVICVHLGEAVSRKLTRLTAPGNAERGPDSSQPELTGVMFPGTTTVVTLLLAGLLTLAARPLAAQISPQDSISPRKAPTEETKYNILIPVKTEQLKNGFQGLAVEQFPDVVYVTADLSQRLQQKAAAGHSLDQFLYHAADYTGSWNAQGQLQWKCRYEVIDPTGDPLQNRLVLPLRNIAALAALKAVVNGESVNITPLSDGSGLEIPLPVEALLNPTSEDSSAVAEGQTFDLATKSFRRYEIELEVIPARDQVVRGTRSLLQIPPVMQTRLKLQPPENAERLLLLRGSESLPMAMPERDQETRLSVGNLASLSVVLSDQEDMSMPEPPTGLRSVQADVLCSLYPGYAEVQLNLQAVFSPLSVRQLHWHLPTGVHLRSVHGAQVNLLPTPADQHFATAFRLTWSPEGTGTSTAHLNLIIPLAETSAPLELLLPELLEAELLSDPDYKWQVAIQPRGAAELGNVEFPETSSSRIVREDFLLGWPSPEHVQPEAEFFRVRRPQKLRSVWKPIATRLRMDVEHQFQVEAKTLELRSQYVGRLSGQPQWTFPLLASDFWELVKMKATVDGREVPVRYLQTAQGIEFSLAEAVTGQLEVVIRWRAGKGKIKPKMTVTPPRMKETVLTRERLLLIGTEAPQWKLLTAATPTLPSQELTTTGTEPDIDLSTELTDPLPAVSLQRLPRPVGQELPDASGLPLPLPRQTAQISSEDAARSQPVSANGLVLSAPSVATSENLTVPVTTPAVTIVEETSGGAAAPRERGELRASSVPPTLMQIDHAIWPGQNGQPHVGETLIEWEARATPAGQELFVVNLPAGLRVLQVRSLDPVDVETTAERLRIRAVGETSPPQRPTGLLLLRWTQGSSLTYASWQSIPLPDTSLAEKTVMRVFGAAVEPADWSTERFRSWKRYLGVLVRAGGTAAQAAYFSAEATTPDGLRSRAELERGTFPTDRWAGWPAATQWYLEALPEPQREALLISRNGLADQLWLTPGPAMFQSLTATADSPGENAAPPLTHVRLFAWTPLLRGLLLLCGLAWGICLWLETTPAEEASAPQRRLPRSVGRALACGLMLLLIGWGLPL